jgi:predicted metal-dependent hydrolase
MSHLPFLLHIPEEAVPDYVAFWKLWQAGEFFKAHEGLEELWRQTQGEQKLFYNGLIHAVVALYQHQRGNAPGACRQCVRMQEKLAPFAPEFYGVQVDQLVCAVENQIAPSRAQLNETQAAQLENLRDRLKERLNRN